MLISPDALFLLANCTYTCRYQTSRLIDSVRSNIRLFFSTVTMAPYVDITRCIIFARGLYIHVEIPNASTDVSIIPRHRVNSRKPIEEISHLTSALEFLAIQSSADNRINLFPQHLTRVDSCIRAMIVDRI
ncbi:uncharacterized protein LOC143150552 [Ptiloglossa arizonensis]|uniref:uncharacterized protein LOC143150552 n=1 Tax=Ptiloglossa arizonensis TaxID=3350558 RepID=UPI003FA01B56